MGSSIWLATFLDWEMLEMKHGMTVEPATTPVASLPRWTGPQVRVQTPMTRGHHRAMKRRGNRNAGTIDLGMSGEVGSRMVL